MRTLKDAVNITTMKYNKTERAEIVSILNEMYAQYMTPFGYVRKYSRVVAGFDEEVWCMGMCELLERVRTKRYQKIKMINDCDKRYKATLFNHTMRNAVKEILTQESKLEAIRLDRDWSRNGYWYPRTEVIPRARLIKAAIKRYTI